MIFKPKKRAELIIIFILAVIVAGIEIADLLEYSNVLLDQQEKAGMYFWSFLQYWRMYIDMWNGNTPMDC